MTYTLSTTVTTPYDATVTAVREGLSEQGFGVLTEIDLAATLQEKLGATVPPQVILGACRPQLAHEGIQVDPSLAALLPCNVVVRSVDDSTTVVEAFDPEAMVRLSDGLEGDGGDALRAIVDDARTRLTTMLDSLT